MPDSPSSATLTTTDFLDFEHPAVQDFVARTAGDADDDLEITLRLYYAVRDQIRYDPYSVDTHPHSYRASATLTSGRGWCVPKAILLAACCRAKGIPARLGYADVKNHLTSKRLRESMKTDVFAWHGYTSIFLGGKWVKATPAFNIELCEKANIHPLEFNGREDSIYHEFDRAGQKHMEYLRYRGEFDDLPLARMLEDFKRLYGTGVTEMETHNDDAPSFADDVAEEATANEKAAAN